MTDPTQISLDLARVLDVAPDANEQALAARVAELAGWSQPSESATIRLLVDILRYIDSTILSTPDYHLDTAIVAHGTISSVGLDLSDAERQACAADLGVPLLGPALMAFAGSVISPQLAYAGLIHLVPPPPGPSYPPPWPSVQKRR